MVAEGTILSFVPSGLTGRWARGGSCTRPPHRGSRPNHSTREMSADARTNQIRVALGRRHLVTNRRSGRSVHGVPVERQRQPYLRNVVEFNRRTSNHKLAALSYFAFAQAIRAFKRTRSSTSPMMRREAIRPSRPITYNDGKPGFPNFQTAIFERSSWRTS